MSVNLKSYPFPVVNNENDVSGRFIPEIKKEAYPDYYLLPYSLELTNASLMAYIKAHQAEFVIQISCSNTFYRQVFRSYETSGTIELPSTKLREKVEVSFYVCATADIHDYTLDGLHPDYAGETFSVERGDVLALGGTTSFTADKTYDPLNAPIDSLFRFKPGMQKATTEVELDDDKIVVVLPEEDFILQGQAGQSNLSSIIHASVVLPVLVHAIQQLNDGKVDDHAWAERVREIARDRSITLVDPLIAAQKILGNPIDRCFKDTFAHIERVTGDDK